MKLIDVYRSLLAKATGPQEEVPQHWVSSRAGTGSPHDGQPVRYERL